MEVPLPRKHYPVVNGPLCREDTEVPTPNLVQAISTLDQRFEEFCNMEFNDLNHELQSSMSQNDKKALNIMEKSVKIVNGPTRLACPGKSFHLTCLMICLKPDV